jgi:hypothetical protein
MDRAVVEAAIDKGVCEHIGHLTNVALMDWGESSLVRFKRGLVRALQAREALHGALDDGEVG